MLGQTIEFPNPAFSDCFQTRQAAALPAQMVVGQKGISASTIDTEVPILQK